MDEEHLNIDRKKIQWLLFVPIILWAGLIFYFSSQPYHEQDMTPSLGTIFNQSIWEKMLSPIQFHYSGKEISVEALGVAKLIEFFIRKAAHLLAFFIWGILVVRAIAFYQKQKWRIFIYSFLLVVGHAGFDEMHQHFTGGRTPLLADVILDTLGGLIGIVWCLSRPGFCRNLFRING